MMGWFILLLLFAISLAAFRLLGVRGAMLKAVAAALLLGAAGYALQGRPATARIAGARRAPAGKSFR